MGSELDLKVGFMVSSVKNMIGKMGRQGGHQKSFKLSILAWPRFRRGWLEILWGCFVNMSLTDRSEKGSCL